MTFNVSGIHYVIDNARSECEHRTFDIILITACKK